MWVRNTNSKFWCFEDHCVAADIVTDTSFLSFCSPGTFGIAVYVCIFADPAKSPMARRLRVNFPELIMSGLQRCCGSSASGAISRASHTLFYKANPVMQLVYLAIVLGAWSIMFQFGYPYIPNPYMPQWHRSSGYVVFTLCMTSFFVASKTSAGIITSHTLTHYNNYPFDGVLFKPNQVCPTAKIPKLARSKLDRMTQRHVPRFDHYCAWINNAVGEDNYRVFLIFVTIQLIICWYGTIAIFLIFRHICEEMNLFKATFVDAATGREFTSSKVIVFQFIFARFMPLCGIMLLTGVMALLLTCFLGFHLYLMCFRGMTTNEFYKWKQVVKHHKLAKKAFELSSSHSTASRTVSGKANIVATMPVMTDTDTVNCVGTSAINEEESTVTKNGNITASTIKGEENIVSDPGPLPTYLYNLGFVENIKEVAFPLSIRPVGQREWAGWQIRKVSLLVHGTLKEKGGGKRGTKKKT
jgi:hypothetical protein